MAIPDYGKFSAPEEDLRLLKFWIRYNQDTLGRIQEISPEGGGWSHHDVIHMSNYVLDGPVQYRVVGVSKL